MYLFRPFLTPFTVFEDKRLADEAVAAVEKVVNQDGYEKRSLDQKGATTELKENVV